MSVGLQPLINAQRGVIELIRAELRGAHRAKFSYEFFLRYAKEKHAFFKEATRHFQQTHQDFRGEPLCGPGDVSVYFTADARFSPSVLYSERQAKISLPVHYCFLLDAFTCSMLQRRGESTSEPIEFDPYAEVLLGGFEPSLRALIAGAAPLWIAEPDWQSALCIHTSTLCSLSVLYHEIGHYAAGHTSHYHWQSVQHGSGSASAKRLFHAEDDAADTESGNLTRILAELTADAYAFIRVYLYAEPYDVLESFSVRTPYTFNGLVAPVQACLIPLYLTSLRRRQRRDASEPPTDRSWPSHPPLTVREQNIWNALYFCLSPAAQQWHDVRLTELERTTWVEAGRKAELAGLDALRQHRASVDFSFTIAYYKVRMDFFEGKVRSFDGFDQQVAHTLFAAKSCFVGLHPPLPDESLALVSPLAQGVDHLWALMSSGTNAGFAQSAPRHWFRVYPDLRASELHPPNENSEQDRWIIEDNSSGLGRIIRDPIFKIIDDWMSAIHRYRMGDDAGARIRSAILKVNASEVRILGRTSDLFYFFD